jgi:hypothetical protein
MTVDAVFLRLPARLTPARLGHLERATDMTNHPIVPCLWCDVQAEAAAAFKGTARGG